MLKITSKSWKCILSKKEKKFWSMGGWVVQNYPPPAKFLKICWKSRQKVENAYFWKKKIFLVRGGGGGGFLSQIKWKNLVYLVKIWIWHQFWHWHWEVALVKFECQKFWHSKTAFAMAFAASATILHNWNGTQKWHLQCQIQCQCQCHFFT